MNQKTATFANAALIAAAVVIGIFLYPALPEEMASHWNLAGEADGTMGKFWGVFLLPLIMTLTLGLSILLPLIDPMRANVEAFRRSYQNFFFWLGAFFFYLFVLTIGWNLGWRFNMSLMMTPALSALWFIVGTLLTHSKRNWFLGIRTPWTMMSDRVWEKTHHLGGRLFKISAAVTLLGIFFPQYLLYFILIPIIASVVATIVYSYIEFRRQESH